MNWSNRWDEQESKNWKVKKLGEILEIERGGSPRPINAFLTNSPEGINWIKIGDAKNVAKYIYQTKEKIKPEGVKSSRLVREGDFILSNSMSFGRPYIMKTTGCIHDGWLVLRKKDKDAVDENFLYYVLGSDLIFRQFSKLAAGSTVKNLNISLVKRVEIPLPPIAEQRRIAAILDKADAIRRKRQQAIALTEELLRSTFLEMFGDPVTNPIGWEIAELGDLVSITSGQVDPGIEPYIDMPHIGGENIQANTGIISGVKTPRELGLKSGKYLFKPGEILYSKIRPYLNKVLIASFKGICSADMYVLKAEDSKTDKHYVVYMLRSELFLKYAEQHSTRTNIPKINRSALVKFNFPCPPLRNQKKFAKVCNDAHSMRVRIDNAVTESNNLFNCLLQRAFKGEL